MTALSSNVLQMAIDAYDIAKKKQLLKKPLIAIVDFTLPGNFRRFWIYDDETGKILINTWVSHGSNSGGLIATSFSNVSGSHKSSLGCMITDIPYVGHHGYSLRLKGLERGFNDNVYQRAIVIHSASYVGAGKSGRSFGCFALPVGETKAVIDLIKEGSLLFAYANSKPWLMYSEFIRH